MVRCFLTQAKSVFDDPEKVGHAVRRSRFLGGRGCFEEQLAEGDQADICVAIEAHGARQAGPWRRLVPELGRDLREIAADG